MPKYLKGFGLHCGKGKAWRTKSDLQFILSGLLSLVTTPAFSLEIEDCHLHWDAFPFRVPLQERAHGLSVGSPLKPRSRALTSGWDTCTDVTAVPWRRPQGS